MFSRYIFTLNYNNLITSSRPSHLFEKYLLFFQTNFKPQLEYKVLKSDGLNLKFKFVRNKKYKKIMSLIDSIVN